MLWGRDAADHGDTGCRNMPYGERQSEVDPVGLSSRLREERHSREYCQDDNGGFSFSSGLLKSCTRLLVLYTMEEFDCFLEK